MKIQISWADYKLISYPKNEETIVEAWQRVPKSSEIQLSIDDLNKGNIGTQSRELADSKGFYTGMFNQPRLIKVIQMNQKQLVYSLEIRFI